MRSEALFERHEILAAAATVGAHANAKADGFRQRDVKFLIELFSNWVEHSFKTRSLAIRNTQVSRFLENLVNEGFARRLHRQKAPIYRLTRIGLIELISRMVNLPYFERPERFFLTNFFIESYRDRIFELVKSEGAQFPYSLELELRALLDTKALRERQISQAEEELKKLDARISDSIKTSKLSIELFSQGKSADEVVIAVEKKYPYELNSQKPLSELFSELPADVRRWELEVGSVKRVQRIFVPSRTLLVQYIKLLREME